MKINLLIILLFTSFLSNAQIKKSAFFLGGDIQLYGSKFKGSDSNQYERRVHNYSFSPSFGWVVRDNVIVGGKLLASFFNEKEINPYGYENKGNRIGAGVWMRSYLPLGKSFFLFADASLAGQSLYTDQATGQQQVYYQERGFSVSASLYPGLSYQVRSCLFIEAALNSLVSIEYERKNTEQGYSNSNVFKGVRSNYSQSSSLGNGVPLQVGIRWIIAKK